MSTAAVIDTSARRPRKSGSIRQDRRRAMFWSYVFLIIFVIFFLTPPVYMLITSLKTPQSARSRA
jgi:multiple sugar transport system permease protein